MSETGLNYKLLTQNEIESQLSPYSDNNVLAFLQKIWRWWLGVWSNFSDKKPKLSKFLYTFALFYLFSNLVTIFQWILLLFIPHFFGAELAATPIDWPGVIYTVGGVDLKFIIFGYPVLRDNGVPIIGGGLGYFYSWLIATFLAQVINFPLQRNLTYRSKGNPWYQAMWYLIGWLGINLVIWIIIGNLAEWNQAFIGIPREAMDLINMVIQGGVAMLIFYFIFRVIFPDVHKVAEHKEAHAAHLKTALDAAIQTSDAGKIAAAQKAYDKALEEANKMKKLSNVKLAEKNMLSIRSTCESKIIKVISCKKLLDKKIEEQADPSEIQVIEERLAEDIKLASAAIQERDRIVKEGELIIAQNA